jgi:hypothetical protein
MKARYIEMYLTRAFSGSLIKTAPADARRYAVINKLTLELWNKS